MVVVGDAVEASVKDTVDSVLDERVVDVEVEEGVVGALVVVTKIGGWVKKRENYKCIRES